MNWDDANEAAKNSRVIPPLLAQPDFAYLCDSLDDQQAPEQEFDALSLARPNQEPCVAGANRV